MIAINPRSWLRRLASDALVLADAFISRLACWMPLDRGDPR